MRSFVAAAIAVSLGLAIAPVRADVPAGPLLEALGKLRPGPLASALESGDGERVSLIVQGSGFRAAEERVPVNGDFYVARGPAGALSRLASSSGAARASWSAPLRMLLDQAGRWTRAPAARRQTGLAGDGVYVGIVDSGVDATHPDLRNADGSTRIAWLIDFAHDPAGLYPELEARYGCDSPSFPCRILSATDIDALLENSVQGDEPHDRYGHGTHVASLAVGNGLSDDEPIYVGSAPRASLVVAQAQGPGGVIDQANVLLATRFVFERARDDGVPAVVNISLGTNFGAHDGSSLFEQALASFLGPEEPGRAIVVAAGNSALQLQGLTERYPDPLGVHTEVRVNRGEPTRIPLVTLSGKASTRAEVFVWLHTLPDDDLTLRFDNGAGERSARVAPGETSTLQSSDWGDPDDYQVMIVNSPAVPDETLGVGRGSAAMIVSGTWRSGRTFGVVLEGEGNASLWVEGDRDLTPTSGGGAFFPRSSKQGTITVPATHPALIAVGATLNRDSWIDAEGERIDARELSAISRIELDAVGAFSSGGPTASGGFKPELVAPGINVVGALSDDADPRDTLGSVFFSGDACPSGGQCLVVADRHAVNTGTSMSAPLVAGAIALLMERDPELDSDQIRHYLMAGTRELEGAGGEEQQKGVGALDVVGALQILDLAAGGGGARGEPAREQSRFVLADVSARPEPRLPFEGWLVLRDRSGAPSDPDPSRVTLEADPVSDAHLERRAPSLWRVTAYPAPDSGGESLQLSVLVDGKVVGDRSVPIAVDRHAANPGFSARGGCSLSAPAGRSRGEPSWLVLMLVAGVFARRYRTAR